MNSIEKQILNGVRYVSENQQEDGSFLANVTVSGQRKKEITSPSPFYSSLVLSALHSVGSKESKVINKRIFSFLLNQKSEHWTFNYWIKGSSQAHKTPYPDDLDDTFCALAAMFLFDEKSISGEVMANVVAILTAAEAEEGGPYYTWLTTADAPREWKDVDLAVNSNVAFFLSLQDVELENIIRLVEKAILKREFISPYYANEFSVIYFISRFYKGSHKGELVQYILGRFNKNHFWNTNPLDTALVISALLNLGYWGHVIWEGVGYLKKTQKRNGSWQEFPLVVELIKGKAKYTAGSSALTTAFCIEALEKFNQARCDKKKNDKGSIMKKSQKIFIDRVQKNIEKRFAKLEKNLQIIALEFMQSLLENNRDKQIVLLPYVFGTSMRSKGKLSKNDMIKLSTANVYGWIAYTIFDDFIDEEGNPELLSVATLCLREVTCIFDALAFQAPQILKEYTRVMDEIDAANTWEIQNCRLKIKGNKISIPQRLPAYNNYARLAQRSMGHALGPIAELLLLGHGVNSSYMRNVILFFTNYIIAKQIDDDMHDWEKDLSKGHISSAVHLLLKGAKKNSHFKDRKEIDLSLDSNMLKEIFWHETVLECCDILSEHLKVAQKALKKMEKFCDCSEFYALIDAIERRVEKTSEDQKQTVAFLASYTPSA